ncbi:MAG: hypothetical protein CMI27_04895, partial [Opitutae bacterium]|nr:hypothetical protein [Opitutae bacterium]
MKSSILTFFLSLILGTTLAHGAVIMVSPGQSVQSAIDQASTGDEIVLQAGSYNEDLNVTGKGLTLRAFSLPWVVNSISVSNSSTPSKFENFQLFGDINATGSDLEIRNANIAGNIKVNQGGLKLTKSTIDKSVSINHSANASGLDTQAVILQSTIREKLTCKAKRSWICYNEIRYSTVSGTSEITGNIFNGRSKATIGIELLAGQTQSVIRNNKIHNYKNSSIEDLNNSCIGIAVLENVKAEILNNVIHDCIDYSDKGEEINVGIGIYVESIVGTKIFGNIIFSCYVEKKTTYGSCLVLAPNQGVLLHNNCLRLTHHDIVELKGGVVKKDCIDTDPKLNTNGTLASDSPAINAGPPDPQYNDRDGSRNDIGMF